MASRGSVSTWRSMSSTRKTRWRGPGRAVVDLAADPGPLGIEGFDQRRREVILCERIDAASLHRFRSIRAAHDAFPGQTMS